MRLLTLGMLVTIPTLLLFGQDPSVRSDPDSVNAPQAAVDSPSDQTAVSASDATVFVPLTSKQKVERRAERLVEPLTLFSSALGAGLNQWRNVPPQWGQGSEGYGRRFASAEGFTATHNAVALGFDLALHTDPRYRRLPQAGFGARLWNSVNQTFIANKDSGGKTINVSELAGNFGAGLIANAWNPPGYNSISNGLERGALGLAYHIAKNVAREFLPDVLHPGRRRSSSGNGS